MAWTAPRTWVTAEVVTASLLNTHLRDNMLETVPSIAAGAGQFFIADGANSVTGRSPKGNFVNDTETTTSTSFTDLATSGPSQTTATGADAIVFIRCRLSNDTAGSRSRMSYAVSGDSTISAGDNSELSYDSSVADDFAEFGTVIFEDATLTAGDNTFTAKYSVNADTGTFSNRGLFIFPL